MILAFGEHLSDVDGLNTLGINTQGIFYITRKNFVIQYQWADPVYIYSPKEMFCSFVKYTKCKGGHVSCYREYHLGKTVFIIEYNSSKKAYQVDDALQVRSLTPKVNLKDLLKSIFR